MRGERQIGPHSETEVGRRLCPTWQTSCAIESLIPIFRIDLIWSRGRLLSRMCPCLCTRWLLLFPRGQPSSMRVCLGAGGRGEDHALTHVGSRVGAGMTAAGPGLLAPAGTCACLVVSFSSPLVRLRKAGGLQGSSALSPRPPCPWVFVFCHL